MIRISRLLLVAPVCMMMTLAACSGDVKKEASYPTRSKGSDKIQYSDQKRDTVWGEGKSLGDRLFGSDDDKNDGGGAGIGVNSFLWRASLDTISFMPIQTADPFGGTIITEWYENPETPGERYKANIYILDRQLRADGVRVAIFKQKQAGKDWKDAPVPTDMATNIENTILSRARELRVAQLGGAKN